MNATNLSASFLQYSIILATYAPVYRDWTNHVINLLRKCNKTVTKKGLNIINNNATVAGHLLKNEGYEAIVSGHYITYDTFHEAQFSLGFYAESMKMISLNPKQLPPKLVANLFMIENEVSTLIMVLFVFTSLIIHFRRTTTILKNKMETFKMQIISLINLFPSLLLKGSTIDPLDSLSRMVFGFWLLTCFFVTMAVLCFQISNIPKEYAIIDTLNDVLNMEGVIPLISLDHYLPEMLKNSLNPVRQDVFKKAERLKGLHNPREVYNRIPNLMRVSEFVTFLAFPFYYNFKLKYILPSLRQGVDYLHIGTENVVDAMISLPFSHSLSKDCMEIVNYGLYRTFETQCFQIGDMKGKWHWDTNSWIKPEDEDFVMELQEVYFIIGILFSGCLFSAIICVFELLIYCLPYRPKNSFY